MPRMLRRAAVLGATAHVASNRGAAKAQQQQQQQAAAAPPPPVAEPAAPAAAPAATTDSYAELMRLKELFDAGVLTQEEFDAQKTKILAG
jgi:multidrug resistance efflux pump